MLGYVQNTTDRHYRRIGHPPGSHNAGVSGWIRRWRLNRGLKPDDGFPTMRYVLLHSLSHALIRQFAVECGYTTASIRERIYSRGTTVAHSIPRLQAATSLGSALPTSPSTSERASRGWR